MLDLDSSPYSLTGEAVQAVTARIGEIEERVSLLRGRGTLSMQTIINYYGQKRFEQVAESNAIEGSTLSVGETEVAVLKGITITGHDPAFVRDAIALDRALSRVVEIARNYDRPTDIEQLLEIHGLLLGDRPGAAVFRSDRVRIKGSPHTPPKTRAAVLLEMEKWEKWSATFKDAPAPLRAAVLHAWLTHVHPFIDGNGRVSRAVSNLELIRAGYPPIIFKKKERTRYIESLGESDEGGDLRSFIDLTLDKVDSAITGLELSARKTQGYNPAVERLQRQQEQRLSIWTTGVTLLASMIEHGLSETLQPLGGRCEAKIFEGFIDLEDYVDLSAGRSISGGWAFILNLSIPGLGRLDKLAYVQHRMSRLYQHLNHEGGPSLFWSHSNPEGYPRWVRDGDTSPYALEVTAKPGSGDEWVALLRDGSFEEVNTTDLASRIAGALLQELEQQSEVTGDP